MNEFSFLCFNCIAKLGAGPGGHGRGLRWETILINVSSCDGTCCLLCFLCCKKMCVHDCSPSLRPTHFETRVDFTEDGALVGLADNLLRCC